MTESVVLRYMSDVDKEAIRWYWRGRIARGKINLLDGDPGNDKSTLTAYIAACISTGTPIYGDSESVLGGVVFISPEDGAGDTIRPRLEAAGADLTKIVIMDGLLDPLDPLKIVRLPGLPDDIEWIRAAIKQVEAKLLIIDPLMAMLPAEVSSKSDQDIRRALTPLARMAEEEGVAVILVRHLNKSMGGSPLYRGGGSIGIIGIARVAMLLGVDPTDPEIRILAPSKSNIGIAPRSLSLRIVSSPEFPDAGVIQFIGETHHSASDLLVMPSERERQEEASGKRADAKEWLLSHLAGGSKPFAQIKADAEEAGFSQRTIERAKAELKDRIRAYKSGFGSESQWCWGPIIESDQNTKTATETTKTATKTQTPPPPSDIGTWRCLLEDGRSVTINNAISENDVNGLARYLAAEGPDEIHRLRLAIAGIGHGFSDDEVSAIQLAIVVAERQRREAA